MRKEKRITLTDQEKILLSRIYKLDRQIMVYLKNRPNESTNELLAKTDFIKKANELYKGASLKVKEISSENTRYVYRLINIDK